MDERETGAVNEKLANIEKMLLAEVGEHDKIWKAINELKLCMTAAGVRTEVTGRYQRVLIGVFGATIGGLIVAAWTALKGG